MLYDVFDDLEQLMKQVGTGKDYKIAMRTIITFS